MSSAPPPVPTGPAPRKKPSALASCILLGLILGVVGAIGGGGFWAYRTFIAKPTPATPNEVVASQSGAPGTPTPQVATTPPATPPTPPIVSTTPAADPLGTPVEPAPSPAPAESIATTQPGLTPSPDPNQTGSVTPTQDTADANPVIAAPPTPDDTVSPLPEPLVEPAPADPNPVVAAEPIQTLPQDSPQAAALKTDAERRIDEAPSEVYSDADKQRVRDAIRQAKRVTRVATLRFGNGSAALGSNERARLKKALLTPEAESLMSDSQAVLFILGFADATGTSETNRAISQKRAVEVGEVLKGFKVANTSYAVGIGATTLLSTERQSKNRAVEVWIVQP